MNRRTALGTTPATYWLPKRYTQHQEFTASAVGGKPPASAFAAPDAPASGVAAVVGEFREKGKAAGLALAQKLRLLPGARLYCEIRGETEEQLAARAAKLKAAVTRGAGAVAKTSLAFVEARLTEVRNAIKEGATAPQAVADLPEVPRREIPRWVTYAGLTVSLLALGAGLARGGKKG